MCGIQYLCNTFNWFADVYKTNPISRRYRVLAGTGNHLRVVTFRHGCNKSCDKGQKGNVRDVVPLTRSSVTHLAHLGPELGALWREIRKVRYLARGWRQISVQVQYYS